MLNLQSDVSLQSLNTFHIPVKARYFVEVFSEDDVRELVQTDLFNKLPHFILGGGSNVLFTRDFNGIVVKVSIMGKKTIEQKSDVILEVGAGENWHELVTYAVENKWYGIENLALIPGTVGGAPVQNIAAYGQNLEDVFDSLEAIDVHTTETRVFSRAECRFGYRDSIFKHELKGKYIITKVRLKLAKEGAIETSYFSIGLRYDSVSAELQHITKEPYSINDVYQAVINIRSRKLLDPAEAPTVGSFFINPIITWEKYEELRQLDPELQSYPVDQLTYVQANDPDFAEAEYVKVPVGRLLDTLGWRGRKIGNCIVHEKWASIITHNGQATGEEMLKFVNTIKEDVKEKYGVELESEVTVV